MKLNVLNVFPFHLAAVIEREKEWICVVGSPGNVDFCHVKEGGRTRVARQFDVIIVQEDQITVIYSNSNTRYNSNSNSPLWSQ